MEKLVIHGGAALSGEVKISGAKNAALPILAATLLSEGKFNIANVPLLKDVDTMRRLLANLGITSNFGGEILTIENSGNCGECVAVYDLVRTMRASILVLGPMLAKNGRAKVALPGGCAIGERPVDLHITALEKMGAVIEVKNGYINASCQRLKGAEIIFDKVTVTGTENIIMAATLAEGKTIIRNAAKEPEVADLINFLKAMGAQIQREGSSDIIIYGVNTLNAADYAVMNDRIEAGTFLAAVAACGGVVKITSCPVEFMGTIFDKLISCGLDINIIDNSTVIAKKEGVVISTDIQTAPYPGFPTDMQSQFMAVMLKCDGVSAVTESIFENRFMHVLK